MNDDPLGPNFLGLLDDNHGTTSPSQISGAEALANLDLSDVGPKPIDPAKLKRRLLTPIADLPDEYILAIDNSSLEKFNTCPRSSYYYSILRRERPSSSALVYGGAVHQALERHYTGRSSEGHEAIHRHFIEEPPAYHDWRTPDLACTLFDKYCKHYPLQDEPFTIPRLNDKGEVDPDGHLAVEIPFRIPLGLEHVDAVLPVSGEDLIEDFPDGDAHPYVKKIHLVWQGKIDMFVVDHQGRWWVWDHKTASMLGPTYAQQFYISQQMFGYTNAGRQLTGQHIHGLWLNTLCTRKPTKTGTGFSFLREQISYSNDDLREHRKDIIGIMTEFITDLKAGYFPKKTAWCVGKYGKCPYFDVCCLSPNSRDAMLKSDLYNPVTWSPLD